MQGCCGGRPADATIRVSGDIYGESGLGMRDTKSSPPCQSQPPASSESGEPAREVLPEVGIQGSFDLVAPRADVLIESLRATGYSLPEAVCDLIDNSIAAGARNI